MQDSFYNCGSFSNGANVSWIIGLRAQYYFFQIHTIHHKILKCLLQEKLYSQTAMAKAEEESDVLSDTISKCSICLLSKDVSVPSPLSLDNQKEEYSLPLLFHQGQSYHPTCANFWYNAVREELPTQ